MTREYQYRPGTHSYRTFFDGQMEFETLYIEANTLYYYDFPSITGIEEEHHD